MAKLGENLQEIADRGNGEERLAEESEDGHFIGSGQQHKGERQEERSGGLSSGIEDDLFEAGFYRS